MKIFKTIFPAACFLFICVSLSVAKDGAGNALSLFYKGNLAYKDGDYKGAIASYQEAVAQKFVSGNLYYNLGNAYFKEGKIGQAILNYERAKRFIPRDGDLESNLKYALSLVRNYSAQRTHNFFYRFFTNMAEQWTINEITVTGILFYIFVGGVWLLGLFLNWPRRNHFVGIIIFSIFFITAVSALIVKIQDEENLAVVIKDEPAKFEPRQDTTTYFQLSEGSMVKIITDEDKWFKVIRDDGKIGWVTKASLEKI